MTRETGFFNGLLNTVPVKFKPLSGSCDWKKYGVHD
jgi:hypothetical protein